MKRVTINEMVIYNFKGITEFKATFNPESNSVEGANGTGKSSVYDAYLWCLFGKNYEGKELSVRPIDNNNNLIHKIDTIVEIQLLVDGSLHTIKRKQYEDWSVPRGSSEEIFKGYVTERYFDDVPMSVREFTDKMNAICPIDDWFVLSSITSFMGLKQEDRRKKLQSLIEIESDEQLASDYPSVKKAFAEGKIIDEYLRQIKASRVKSKADLDMIPARIDQQEKLRVNYNFDELEQKAKDLQNRINGIDNLLIAKVTETEINAADKLREELRELNISLSEIEESTKNDRNRKVELINSEVNELNSKRNKELYKFNNQNEEIKAGKESAERLQKRFNDLKSDWISKNKTCFNDTMQDVCPTCGRAFDEAYKESEREKAVQHFNQNKLKALADIQADAESVKKQLDTINENISNAERLQEERTAAIDTFNACIKDAENKLTDVPSVELALSAHKEYQALIIRRDTIKAKIKAQTEQPATNKEQEKAEYKAQKTALLQELNEVQGKLSTKATNAKIDVFKKELEAQSKELAQSIADIDKIEYEIKRFKKRKILIVESSVSSLFDIVSWKMYEPNITNDGEKEICQAIIDGKPYETQNTATKMNAGIDIINGLSKACLITVPLFIDNKESVTNIIDTQAQTISLKVVENKSLTIE